MVNRKEDIERAVCLLFSVFSLLCVTFCVCVFVSFITKQLLFS